MKKKVRNAKTMLKKQRNSIDTDIKHQMDEINDMEHQVKILNMKVKEKSKELSLANLKIKELKRNFRYHTLKPLVNKPGHYTSRKTDSLVKKTIDGTIINNRNSDLYRFDSHNGENGNRNITNSEIRLDRSDSSLMSNDQKQKPVINEGIQRKPKRIKI